MIYIGITGHRGAGKTAISYLLGNILERLKRGDQELEIQEMYNTWCEEIRLNNNAIYDCSLNYIYFDEFGEYAKSFVAQLLSVDMSLLDSDSMKDNMYVNLKDFSMHTNKSEVAIDINTYINSIPKTDKPMKLKTDTYISLRNFIELFSVDIMQRYFGADVWLKTRKISKEKYGEIDLGWRIFSDVKLIDEAKYIKSNNGFIIKVTRPSNRKVSTKLSFSADMEADYMLETEGSLEELFNKIFNIAKDIYGKSR